MKLPTWLDKERLYHIIFLADTPAGKTYDVLLIIGILASIITAFVESMPSLAHPFQVALEVLEYFFAVIFTFDYVARLYCSPSRREYALSFFGIIDLISTAPPYLAFIFPGACSACSVFSMKVISFWNRYAGVSTRFWSISSLSSSWSPASAH